MHKFHPNQTVLLSPSRSQNVPGGAYIVTKNFPIRDGEFEYRIESIKEPFERELPNAGCLPSRLSLV